MTPEEIAAHHKNWAAERGINHEDLKLPPAPVDPPRVALEEFPCVHRGQILYQVGCGCGDRDRKINVHACAVEGECTVESPGKSHQKKNTPPGTESKLPCCISCPLRKEEIETVPEPEPEKPAEPLPIKEFAADIAKAQEAGPVALRYADDLKLPVIATLNYHDLLPFDHPGRLPSYLVEGLRRTALTMETPIPMTQIAELIAASKPKA